MWFVYILLCEDSSLYTGISDDVLARFEAHRSGKGSKYTRSHKPIKIVYQEQLSSKSLALKRELEIKSWPRNRKIRELNLKIT
jgi:putative endonuclease